MASSTDSLEALALRLKDLHISPAWDTAAPTRGQARRDSPRAWHWSDIRDALDQMSLIDVGSENVDRRVVSLSDGIRERYATTGTICAAVQMLLPNEVAPPHRHTATALRFVLEGSGAYTVVNGARVDMSVGDLVLTPSWTWHEHASKADGPMLWLDALDFPFVRFLEAAKYEAYPDGKMQEIIRTADPLVQIGPEGMLNPAVRDYPQPYPQLVYPWADAERSLQRAIHNGAPDVVDGHVLEYVNPVTGGHCLSTLACFAHAFPKGYVSARRRRVSSSVCVVMAGTGKLLADDICLEFSRGDIYLEPAATWCQYEVSEDTFIFRVSDMPMLEPFNLERVDIEI